MAKSSVSLKACLAVMAALIVVGLIIPQQFKAIFTHPEMHLYAKFFHILSVTLVFGNAVIGTLWETRGLLSKRPEVIRYTYQTVTWMDSIFTAPLILMAVVSGIIMATNLGGVWTIGWLSIAFVIFLISGLVWIVLDIPTQYKVNKLFAAIQETSEALPQQILKLLWFRLGLNILSLLPLIVVFILMVFKPDLAPIQELFNLR